MKKRRWTQLLILAATAVLCLIFVSPVLYPWTTLNCEDQSIDLSSGRYRFERYLLGMRISDRIEESSLAKLYSKHIGKPQSPRWVRVNTFSPGIGQSPHYAYHGAFFLAHKVTEALEGALFTPEAEHEVVVSLFSLLQSNDSDYEAKEYASEVWKAALEHGKSSDKVLTIHDLPKTSSD